MQPLLQKATFHLKRRGNVGALGIMTWVVGANAGAALAQHLNQIVAGAISDCIGSQILQSVSVLAAMDGGEFEYDGIAIQVLAALIGSTLLTIFPQHSFEVAPARALRPEHASMFGVAIE